MQRKLLISTAAFFVGLCVAFVYLREPMVDLTDDSLASAIAKWRAARVGDYDLSLVINGQRYELTVRKNTVERFLLNGQRPERVDEQAYTVDGLFGTLAMELENLTDPSGAFAAGRNVIYARVRFNEELGYPERYIRNGVGGGRGASIEVVRFEPHS